MQFTDRKLFIKDRTNCTDGKLNSRTVTVQVYWTTLKILNQELEKCFKLGTRNVHHKRNKMTPVGLGTITTVLSLVLS